MSLSINTQLTPGVPPLALEGALAFLQAQLEQVFPSSLFAMEVMPPRVTAQTWKNLLRRTPFVGIGWGGVRAHGTASGVFAGDSEFSVVLVVKNVSSIRARLVGDERGIGVMPMVRAAVAVLHGATAPGVGSFQVVSAELGFAEEMADDDFLMAVVAVSARIGLPLAAQIAGITESALTALGLTWLIDGGASIITTEGFP